MLPCSHLPDAACLNLPAQRTLLHSNDPNERFNVGIMSRDVGVGMFPEDAGITRLAWGAAVCRPGRGDKSRACVFDEIGS
ncbi:hypothetical protein ACQW02_18345 [Humitalea sp. 24SJ18S-53]|uniref:hypothetical protein n=1 Tax=Humitalea sp. 24SJ18S-53 TaxID=3422307 RepID=UPI003D67094A